MLSLFKKPLTPSLASRTINYGLLFFRIGISLELIIVHGLKKVGIGGVAEIVPNPFGIPEGLNQILAIAGNLFFPQLIIMGLFTRYATLPILAITLSGYFIVHFNDPLLVKDTPFMFSICFMLIAITGPSKYSLDHYFFKNIIG